MVAMPLPYRFLKRLTQRDAIACLGGIALLMGGCAEKPTAQTPLFAVDFAGAAKSCKVSAVDLSTGKSADATMALVNDGGWCAISVSQKVVPPHQEKSGWLSIGAAPSAVPKPFAAGLVETRAEHGEVYVHAVGDATRIDYTPDTGYAGNDRFAVRFVPGNAVLTVAVTVTGK